MCCLPHSFLRYNFENNAIYFAEYKYDTVKNMRNFFRKTTAILIAIIITIGVTGCMQERSDFVSEVKSGLQMKYMESFDVKKVGNRLNSDTVTLYCYSVKCPDNLFKVVYSEKTKTMKDSYVKDKISFGISEEICDIFSQNDLSSCCSVDISCENANTETNTSISAEEFIDRYSASKIIARVAVNQKNSEQEKIEDTLELLNNTSSKYCVDIIVSIFYMNDEQFQKCQNEISDAMNPTDTWFNSYLEQAQDNTIVIEYNG